MNTRENRKVQDRSKLPNLRHAVALGGSLAGLLAARVLSDYFDRVTLLERDVYPDNTDVRKGIPQANHVHGLMLRGRRVLEDLFPKLQDEMIAAGAPLVDMANDVAWFTRSPLEGNNDEDTYRNYGGTDRTIVIKRRRKELSSAVDTSDLRQLADVLRAEQAPEPPKHDLIRVTPCRPSPLNSHQSKRS